MPMRELLRVLDLMQSTGCRHWLTGGWGIDALAGRQTRDHQDVDIDFDATREDEILTALETLGYRETLDERPTRFELEAAGGLCVDLHPLHLDRSGDARQQAPDGSWWHFRHEWFTTGTLERTVVPCYTAEGQRYFHSGYELQSLRQGVDVFTALYVEHMALEETLIYPEARRRLADEGPCR